jgi:uracil phosphoribosyltransferase
MLNRISKRNDCSIYKIEEEGKTSVNRLVISSAETRAICNDTTVMGVNYTRKLRKACSMARTSLQDEQVICLEERKTIVFNILRGGLNFGLREAIADAFDWNLHGSSFISAQRARINPDSEEWHIIESDYQKVYMPQSAQIVIGDVVATGTSLEFGLEALVKQAEINNTNIESILFFTYGGKRTEEILENVDALCRAKFKGYQSTTLCYIEGRFTVPTVSTPLTIKLTGTDLVKREALMAPEFVESQYENPAFPMERCVIYDAGSRAFWLPEYLEDVIEYWEQVHTMARRGRTFEQQVGERVPNLDCSKFGAVDLEELASAQLTKLKSIANS